MQETEVWSLGQGDPWRREWLPALGDCEGRGSQACCSLRGCKELDTTEWLNSNNSPLQYSYLGNPMDRGAWWTTPHGVEKSRSQLTNLTTEPRQYQPSRWNVYIVDEALIRLLEPNICRGCLGPKDPHHLQIRYRRGQARQGHHLCARALGQKAWCCGPHSIPLSLQWGKILKQTSRIFLLSLTYLTHHNLPANSWCFRKPMELLSRENLWS